MAKAEKEQSIEFARLEAPALEIFAAMVSRSHDHGNIQNQAEQAFELAEIYVKAADKIKAEKKQK